MTRVHQRRAGDERGLVLVLFSILMVAQGGDPSRVAGQIITGIGFLGAGTIMQARGTITGLTSAATIWVVCAIGITHGASDEWSFRAAEHPTYCYDVHATVLHLLGIDHTRLTYRHNGIDRRLTDVHGHVIDEILE